MKEVFAATLAAPACKDALDPRLRSVVQAACAQGVVPAGGAQQSESPRAPARDHLGDEEGPAQDHPVDHDEQADTRRQRRWTDILVDNEHTEYADYQNQSIGGKRCRPRLVEVSGALGVLGAGERWRGPPGGLVLSLL